MWYLNPIRLTLQLTFVTALIRFSSFLDYLKQEICGIFSIYEPKENILNYQEVNFEFFKEIFYLKFLVCCDLPFVSLVQIREFHGLYSP